MIMAEEKMRERFLDKNNRENNRDNSDRRNFPNMGHPDRKRRPDNTVTMANKTKKFSKFRRFKVYGTHKETTQHETTKSSLIGTQGKKKIRINKRITRRKMKTTQKTKDANSQREQLQ
jgi:hypothetical protein